MKLPTPTLRIQLAGIMICAVVISIMFGYVGLTQFAKWQERSALAAMPPEERRIIAQIAKGQTPSASKLLHVYQFQQRTSWRIEQEQDLVLILLGLAASLSGVGVGFVLAARLARPLGEIGNAAREIAKGNLSARASSDRPGSGELHALLTDFNSMAATLESYDRDLRESSASIAHELRTPLTILLGQLQSMLDGVFERDDKTLASAIRQVDLLTRIIEDLRTLSLANTGRLQLVKSRIDLKAVAGDLLAAHNASILQQGLAPQFRLASAPVLADRERIEQILLALVENVARHARDGGIVEIETGMKGDNALLIVLDRGPGIPEGARERVFDLFWRADPYRDSGSKGTGLGLAVVKAIVTTHGGHVTISARPLGGTKVTISLPAAR